MFLFFTIYNFVNVLKSINEKFEVLSMTVMKI